MKFLLKQKNKSADQIDGAVVKMKKENGEMVFNPMNIDEL